MNTLRRIDFQFLSSSKSHTSLHPHTRSSILSHRFNVLTVPYFQRSPESRVSSSKRREAPREIIEVLKAGYMIVGVYILTLALYARAGVLRFKTHEKYSKCDSTVGVGNFEAESTIPSHHTNNQQSEI